MILLFVFFIILEGLLNAELIDRTVCYIGSSSVLSYYELKKYYSPGVPSEDVEEEELILSLASLLGLAKEEEIRNIIDKIKSNFSSEEAFLKALEKEGIYSEDELKEYYRRQQKKYKLYEEEIISLLTLPEKKTKELKERSLYKFYFAHILSYSLSDAEEALHALNKGVPFSLVAKDKSICPVSAKSDGILGTYSYVELDENIAEALFLLPVGSFSSPIKTEFGYHIVKLLNKTEENKLKIMQNFELLMNREKNRLQNLWITYIIKEGREKIYIEFIKRWKKNL